jgi:hypothetical protein
MGPEHDTLRDRLLAQTEPDPARLARYREEVRAMLERQEKTLWWQKWYAGASWFATLLVVVLFLILKPPETPTGGVWLMPYIIVLLVLVAGAVELLRYYLNRSRVELLKEIKGLELLVRELKDQLPRR